MSSEVQSRPAAARGGRGAARGGRGGFAGRGSTRRANGEAKTDGSSLASLEDEGEIGQLKKLYSAKTTLIREMFPDWSEVDILFALRETDGDENLTVTRIAEGTISQWDEVSKPKKERAKPKPSTPSATDTARPARREGAGSEKTRGRGSARNAERGGRSARGRSAQPAATNGTHASHPLSIPTEESQAWEGHKPADDEPAPTAASAPSAPSAPAAAAPKTWASMLRQTVAPPPKPAARPKEAPPPQKAHAQPTDSLPPSSTPAPSDDAIPAAPTPDTEPESTAEDAAATPVAKEAAAPDVAIPAVAVPDISIAPSKDALTEHNLEQVVDVSHAPDTDTARSEADDSWDPRVQDLPGTNTPISASQQQHVAKALGSGYAATAAKATDRVAMRTPSYSRRVLDQEEAVRMPVNREVDRAAVQFGALNFNGAGDEDIDGDREEPETRTQPPDDSPVSHPRASLPPVAPPASVPDAFAAQKPAAAAAAAVPSAPSASSATSTLPPAPAAAAPAAIPTGPAAQAAQNTQQFGRYGQPAPESAFGQKPYDAYGQPVPAPASANAQFDNYQGIPAATQAQPAPTAYSSAPNEYSQYFTSDTQNRMPQYNSYYQAYGQQAAQGHQDGAQNQRSYGAYDTLSQYPQSSGASRFGAGAVASSATVADAQNSGSNTPNPPVAGQPQAQPQAGAQGQHMQQQHQGSQYQSYTHHPYYANPYYAQYMQYGAFGGQSNFGPYGAKSGYGGNQHPYGMTPQNPYDHNASPASGGFGGASSLHRGAAADSSGLGSAGLSDYGRVGAGQSVGQPAGFGGAAGGHETSYGRGGASSYQSPAGQGYGAQQPQVGSQQAGADDLKPYGDASKAASGPNPSLARPGSATNTQSAQTGLPPPQSSQQGGYGGYPSHLQHAAGGLHGSNPSPAGGAGGYGGNQNPYGSYGGHNAQHGGHGQGFGSNYYSNQQQRGWGGNYH